MRTLTQVLFAGLALLAVGCSNDGLDSENKSNQLTPVTVHVDGFSVEQESFARMTRAVQSLKDYDGVNSITLAFYQGDTEAYKSTQTKTESDFGEFSLSLPMGTYTMVVVAYTAKEGSPFVLTSPTEAAYTGDHAYETFTYTQSVTISTNDPIDLSATLSRAIAELKVVSSDGKTDNVTNVRMTFSAGGKSFNPSTGFATIDTGFANTVGISAATGAKSTSLSVLFLTTDEQTMDVTIETLDADGNTLFSETVNNVPFKRNRVTKLTGDMYTNSKLFGFFKVDTDWLSEEEMNF